jgi:hypothetical protein
MAAAEQQEQAAEHSALEQLALMQKDYSKLKARISTHKHIVKCDNEQVTLRVHYPSFRQSRPTVDDLVDAIFHYLVGFAIPRQSIKNVHEKYGTIPPDEYDLLVSALKEEAKDLFKLAHKKTNRNGEAGELLLYLLTEWQIGAPQILAKMSLKTDPNMAVHGADGVHALYSPETKSLRFFWGEAKLYATLASGLSAAMKSIKEALQHDSLKTEIQLINRFVDFSGLNQEAKEKLLEYLDPLNEKSNDRINVVTCLIGFNFPAYADMAAKKHDEVPSLFGAHCDEMLKAFAKDINHELKEHGIQNEIVEVFLFPVPSVQELRDKFQAKIGWHQ